MDRPVTARPWGGVCFVLAVLIACLLIAPAALAAVSTGDGGWVWQRGLDAGTSYADVMFASETSGWVVGSGGRILHTFDGGDTWYRQRADTDRDLFSVDVPDGQNGWAVGAGGTILRTTDGGDTWVAQPSTTTNRLFSVGAVSAHEAWAVGGSPGRLFHTTDGGTTWQTATLLDGYVQWGGIVFDADRLHGWIPVGTGEESGLVLRTSDGGQTWERAHTGCAYVPSALASNGAGTVIAGDQGGYLTRSTDWGATWQSYPAIYLSISSLAFASPDAAWATTSKGGLLRTTNGGQSWRYVTSKPWYLASLAFATETDGWAVGVNGSMVRTDATGQHWQTIRAEASEQLWDLVFPDAATGWAIGFESTALRTTDGGETWVTASPRRPEKFLGVESAGGHAWAVGTAGSIFASDDAGAHWSAQDSGTSDDLSAVAFGDADHGWAAGASGTILRTVDGGAEWTPCESGTFSAINDVSIVDEQTAWFVAGGTATTTNDGGASFRSVTLPETWFSLIDFVDAEHGWVADGQGRLYRTSDGGDSWDNYSFGATRIFFKAIQFSSATDGWAFDAHGWTTTDGGQTWTPAAEGWDATLAQPVQAVDFDGDAGWAVGYGGTILATTDRGATWVKQSSTTAGNLTAVAAGADGKAVAVGENGLIDSTTDAGATWAAQMIGLPRNLSALSAFDASTACVAGQYGFSRTSNGGGLWSFLPQGYGGAMMDFPDPMNGWMTGYSGELAHTTDGGLTWQPQSLGVGTEFIWDVDFLDSQHGWILGLYNRIYKTTDGGVTWTPYNDRSLDANHIHFLDEDVGWAVGSYSISKTTDGGETWQKKADSPPLPPTTGRAMLTGIDFADAQHGWAVGEGGAIMATTDGGETWVTQDPGTTQWLRAVAATSAQSVWIVGENGGILHTTNGGFPRPDDAPPVTTLDVTPQAPGGSAATSGRSAAGAEWLTAAPELELAASDANGVQVTAWSVDPSSTKPGLVPWRRGTAPVLTGQGMHLICYRSVDDAGNAEKVKSRALGIDQTAPVPKAPRAASVTRGKKATLKFSVTDVRGSTQSVTLLIKSARGKLMKRVVLRGRAANTTLSYSFVCSYRRGTYRFSVSAVDPVGLASATRASNSLRVR